MIVATEFQCVFNVYKNNWTNERGWETKRERWMQRDGFIADGVHGKCVKKKKKESGKTKKSTTMNPWRSILMDSWRGLLNFTCTTKQCNNLQWFSFSFYSSFAFNTRASNFLIYFTASFNAWNTRVCKCVYVIYVHNPWKKKKEKKKLEPIFNIFVKFN